MKPALHQIESTAIRAYAHYLATDALGTENSYLVIWFNNGNIYEYSGVPDHIFDGLRTSASAGKFYNQAIKGKYEVSPILTV